MNSSLAELVKCSDTEFDRQVREMDSATLYRTMTEIISEMDSEQSKFEQLSEDLKFITDQTSSAFKDKSAELVKSQNRLALLMNRNMVCFKMSHAQKARQAVGKDNKSNDMDMKEHDANFPPMSVTTPDINKNTISSLENAANHDNGTKKKVVKVTRIVTKKVINSSDNMDPSLKKILDARKEKIQSIKKVDKTGSTSLSQGIVDSGLKLQPIVLKDLESSQNQTTQNQSNTSSNALEPQHNIKLTSTKGSDTVKPSPQHNTKLTSTEAQDTVKLSLNVNVQSPPSNGKESIRPSPRHDPQPSPIQVTVKPVQHTLQSTEKSHGNNSQTVPNAHLKASQKIQFRCKPAENTIESETKLSTATITLSTKPKVDVAKVPSLNTSSADLLAPTLPTTDIDDLLNSSTESASQPVKLFERSRESSESSNSSNAPDIAFDFSLSDFDNDKVKERVFVKSWNPELLLNELYSIKDGTEDFVDPVDAINMEGYIEQLPVGKQKTTLLKTWKRVYCQAKDGFLHFYRSKNFETDSSSYLCLIGGAIEENSGRMIGIDDKRGHYLMVRCPSDDEYSDWLRCLHSQTKCLPSVKFVRPVISSTPHSSRVLVIDLGSCSVRAGILSMNVTLPQLFFPCVTTTDKTGKQIFGFDCYKPENRGNGLYNPVTANSKSASNYKINVNTLKGLFLKIFTELKVSSSDQYSVLLSTPHRFSSHLQEQVLNTLLTGLQVKAAYLIHQSLLTPYIYNATSGIVVDIGERIDIVAIIDGYLVEGGVLVAPFGGKRITETLNSSLMEFRLFTPVEHLITRHVKEQACYISQNYEEDLLDCTSNSKSYEASVDLTPFKLPDGFHLRQVTVDAARFKATEGLLKAELFGVDSPTLPQLIKQVILKCPMDTRKEMWQSIYLNGGTSLTQGFTERLTDELKRIAPANVTVQVHANPYRYHGAYMGACILAKSPNFLLSCITREEWDKSGRKAFAKWNALIQG